MKIKYIINGIMILFLIYGLTLFILSFGPEPYPFNPFPFNKYRRVIGSILSSICLLGIFLYNFLIKNKTHKKDS